MKQHTLKQQLVQRRNQNGKQKMSQGKQKHNIPKFVRSSKRNIKMHVYEINAYTKKEERFQINNLTRKRTN